MPDAPPSPPEPPPLELELASLELELGPAPWSRSQNQPSQSQIPRSARPLSKGWSGSSALAGSHVPPSGQSVSVSQGMASTQLSPNEKPWEAQRVPSGQSASDSHASKSQAFIWKQACVKRSGTAKAKKRRRSAGSEGMVLVSPVWGRRLTSSSCGGDRPSTLRATRATTGSRCATVVASSAR